MKKFEKFSQHCMKNANYIFIREKINNKWQNKMLSELSKKKQLNWIYGMWKLKSKKQKFRTKI